MQSRFYAKRARERGRDADKWMRLSSYSIAGAAIAAGLSGLDPALIWIAALGAVATAYGSFASTKDAVNQSRRTADLYSKAEDAIGKLQEKRNEVRAAASAGEHEPVKQFVTALHEQLAAEHRQWLQAAESIQPLEQTLSDLQAKRKGKQPPETPQGEAAGRSRHLPAGGGRETSGLILRACPRAGQSAIATQVSTLTRGSGP